MPVTPRPLRSYGRANTHAVSARPLLARSRKKNCCSLPVFNLGQFQCGGTIFLR